MIRPDELEPSQWAALRELHGPFAPCEDVTEVMLVVHKLGGMRAVEFVLDKSKMSKETLREAADRLKRVGLVDLAQLLRQHARRAKPRPPLTQRAPTSRHHARVDSAARRHLACYLTRRRRGLRARAQHEIDAVAIEGDRHEAARQTDQTSLRL
jgi:hypothetical protein